MTIDTQRIKSYLTEIKKNATELRTFSS